MGILRKFLLPMSLIYGLITQLRNVLYDRNIFKSTSFNIPVITVGNLSVGGTGKTPMIEFLLELLIPLYKTAALSRGYGRKSKGYVEVKSTEPAEKVGDEPLQFKLKFPETMVAVDEDRRHGISKLLAEFGPEIILLDDAFQHRKVKAGYNILLSSYDNLYVDDYILPAGNLRESSAGAARADIIVITKCPGDLKLEEQQRVVRNLNLQPHQEAFFSSINYADYLYDTMGNKTNLENLKGKPFSLVTGIAKPGPLVKYLQSKAFNFNHLKFPDHHNFSSKDLEKISHSKIILTTEKDFMRLKNSISHPQLYYLPIQMEFLNGAAKFRDKILEYVKRR